MSTTRQIIARRIEGSLAAIASLREEPHITALSRIIDVVKSTLTQGGTIFTCGNGGSAAEALHLAEELVGRYRGNRPPRRSVCLNADPTALTCIANDFGFEQVFARQCAALLSPGDALVVFSTSGNSPNIVQALATARSRKAACVGLLGRDGGESRGLCDHSVVVPSDDSAHIQEAHQVVLHLLCEALETP